MYLKELVPFLKKNTLIKLVLHTTFLDEEITSTMELSVNTLEDGGRLSKFQKCVIKPDGIKISQRMNEQSCIAIHIEEVN